MAEYIVNKHSHSGICNSEDCLNELMLYQQGIASIEGKETFIYTWKNLIEGKIK